MIQKLRRIHNTNLSAAVLLGPAGYRQILECIYRPAPDYPRIRTFLREYKPSRMRDKIRFCYLQALIRSIHRLGIVGRQSFRYWKLRRRTRFHFPRLFSTSSASTCTPMDCKAASSALEMPGQGSTR